MPPRLDLVLHVRRGVAMSRDVEGVLRDILVRHGTALLDDHRRFEACVRDSQLSPREIAGIRRRAEVRHIGTIAPLSDVGPGR
jgi:hypothetical protein